MRFFLILQRKRIVYYILFLIFFFLSGYTPGILKSLHSDAFAQDTNATDTINNLPKDLPSLTQTVTNEVLVAVTCQLGGINPVRPDHKCLVYDLKTKTLGYSSKSQGLIGTVTTLISSTYNIPVNSHQYYAYMKDNFTPFGQKAYAQAQGVGFVGLTPLLGIWVQFRNIVYLLFVAIFVIIGFAIMLRVKIDPRTVMTVENQLPKLIIGIVLVTFSYAIAGLLIDLMWLGTFTMINILAQVDANIVKGSNIGPTATGNLFQSPFGYANEMLNNGPWGGILGLAGSAGRGLQMVISNLFSNGNVNTLGLTPPGQADCGNTFFLSGLCNIGHAIGDTVGTIMSNVIGWIVSWIIGIIAMIVILIALLVTLFRVWLTLIKAYVSILLSVIFAPFTIALGVLPGSSVGFTGWVRSLGANLLAFPATVFMFVIARVLIDSFSNPNGSIGAGGALFVPPLIGNPNGSGTDNPLGGFIALGMVLMTPSIVQQMRDALKAPINKYVGASVGAGLSAGNPLQAFQRVGQLGYTWQGLGHTPLARVLPFLRQGGGGGGGGGRGGP